MLLGATALRCINSGAREDKNIYVWDARASIQWWQESEHHLRWLCNAPLEIIDCHMNNNK